jgi:uncharacterized protein (DUF1684 family)
MKKQVLTICLLLACCFSAAAQDFDFVSNEVTSFRALRDRQFRVPQQSPLTDDDLLNFKGLDYFSFDEKFVVKAKMERAAEEKFIQLPTSTGMSEKYLNCGVLTFELDGQNYSLTAYQSAVVASGKYPAYNNILFVPFRDLTNGKETYGAGRFLNPRIAGDEVTLNFNLAYNPNCSYGSNKFACPIPPRENFLQAKIFAGEKRFVPAGEKTTK